MANPKGKGRPRTNGMIKRNPASDMGAPANSDLVEYTPPMVLNDLRAVKDRIRKATYKGRDLNQLAKVFTVDALTVLVECVQDTQHSMSDRIRASEILLNRGWGRARETVDINTTSIEISAPDIMAIINARRAQVVGLHEVSPDTVDIASVSEADTGGADG